MESAHIILFDLDGTLLDSKDLLTRSYCHALRETGRPIEHPMEWYITQRLVEVFDDGEAGLIGRQKYRDYYTQHAKDLRLFPGTLHFLNRAKEQGCQLGVVTNKESQRANADLERVGITPYFDVVVTTEDTVFRKPEADPLLWAVHKLRGSERKVVYVGDNPVDITSARLAGCHPIGVTWGYFSQEALSRRNPCKVVNSYNELEEILFG